MRKKAAWLKSLIICLVAIAIMAGTGFYLMVEASETPLSVGNVESARYEQEDKLTEEVVPVLVENNVAAEESQVEAVTVEDKAEEKAVEQLAAVPVVVEIEALVIDSEVVRSTEPVSYTWGTSNNYIFRIEVEVTNSGAETSRNVMVSVPLLENSSPYQTTTLKSVNYEIVSSTGRVSTVNLGDLVPGETKTITADFTISVRTVTINSSNETVEKARLAFEKHVGSGNCRDLARAFISELNNQGITAREVIGFARPQYGVMASGSLQGCRHSWAEFYVDGLGWVPVDLTFKYFGTFPQTSHIVESYSDQPINVNYTGGSLNASWSNSVL